MTFVVQCTPIDGSKALRPRYSTVNAPELVCVIGVRTPGASKFSYPIFGPASAGAAGKVGVKFAGQLEDAATSL